MYIVCENLPQTGLASTPVTQTYSTNIQPQKYKTPTKPPLRKALRTTCGKIKVG